MEHKIIVYKELVSSYPLKETLFRPSEDYLEYLFKGDISVDKIMLLKWLEHAFGCMVWIKKLW